MRYHIYKASRTYQGMPYTGASSLNKPAQAETLDAARAICVEMGKRNPVGWRIHDTHTQQEVVVDLEQDPMDIIPSEQGYPPVMTAQINPVFFMWARGAIETLRANNLNETLIACVVNEIRSAAIHEERLRVNQLLEDNPSYHASFGEVKDQIAQRFNQDTQI